MELISKKKVLEITARHLPPTRWNEIKKLPVINYYRSTLIVTPFDAYCQRCGFDFYDYNDEYMEEFYNFCPCCGARFTTKETIDESI